jgi:mono/diheme cytochrome c family protein
VKTSMRLAMSAFMVLLVGIVAIPAANAQDAGNAIRGRQLYYDYLCYGCHGYTGETGRSLLESPMLNTEAGFRSFLRLRADVNPLLPSTRMPNYGEEALSDEQVRDIYAFIQTFESHAPDLEDIPTLNAIIDAASRPYEP